MRALVNGETVAETAARYLASSDECRAHARCCAYGTVVRPPPQIQAAAFETPRARLRPRCREVPCARVARRNEIDARAALYVAAVTASRYALRARRAT